uniref:Uncharacterized protein n=1 Tax=Timema douglasi TaxID=61478 RepID=A0A7R8VU46_TIMDO|nr:unnamed protein product [Timema douglasi]
MVVSPTYTTEETSSRNPTEPSSGNHPKPSSANTSELSSGNTSELSLGNTSGISSGNTSEPSSSLILASGPPEVGMSGETGEAVEASPTVVLRKDQRETAEKNKIKIALKALTKPSRKDTTTQSLQNKPKPLLKREVQDRLGKARGPKKDLNKFLFLKDTEMDYKNN